MFLHNKSNELQDFQQSWSEFTTPKKPHWSVFSIKKDHPKIYYLAFKKSKDKETLTIQQKWYANLKIIQK